MKKLLLFYFLVSIISAICYSQDLSENLIVYYPFNGNSFDKSGNNLDAILNGPVSVADRFGADSGAFHFNGISDYIELPYSQILKPALPVTIAFWVKTESFDEYKNKFVSTDFQYDNYCGCWVSLKEGGYVSMHYGENTGNAGYEYRRSKISATSVTFGEWVHITAVYRGATDMSIYINGTDAGGMYDGTGLTAIGYSGSVGRIGCTPGQTSSPETKYFLGAMDDFAMWDRALTDEDVTKLYTNGIHLSVAEYREYGTVKLYPNPCHHEFSVNFENLPKKELQFKLYSISGRLNKEYSLQKDKIHVIDVVDLNRGIYLYRIMDDQMQLKSGKLCVY